MDAAPYGCWLPLSAQPIGYTRVPAFAPLWASSMGHRRVNTPQRAPTRENTRAPENPPTDSRGASRIHGLVIFQPKRYSPPSLFSSLSRDVRRESRRCAGKFQFSRQAIRPSVFDGLTVTGRWFLFEGTSDGDDDDDVVARPARRRERVQRKWRIFFQFSSTNARTDWVGCSSFCGLGLAVNSWPRQTPPRGIVLVPLCSLQGVSRLSPLCARHTSRYKIHNIRTRGSSASNRSSIYD